MKKEDASLIRKAKKDPKEYGKLYEKYAQRVYGYVFRRVGGSKEIAEDIVQDTFTRGFRALSRFRVRKASYVTYLLSIAHNLLTSTFRRKRETSVPRFPEHMVSGQEDLLGEMYKIGDREAVQALLDQLPSEQRDLLQLRYEQGFSYREIARKIGSTENAVKLKFARIRKRLEKAARSHPTLFDRSNVNSYVARRK